MFWTLPYPDTNIGVAAGCKVPLQAPDGTIAHMFATKTGNHTLGNVACLKSASVATRVSVSGQIVLLLLSIIVVLLISKDFRGLETNHVVQQAYRIIILILIVQLALGIRTLSERLQVCGAYRRLIFFFPFYLVNSCGDWSIVTRLAPSLLGHTYSLRQRQFQRIPSFIPNILHLILNGGHYGTSGIG
jgi:hypothetical protein